MLYLYKAETKAVVQMKPEQFFEIGRKQVETLIKYMEEGKIVAGGAMPGRRGSCTIWDVESNEEVQNLIAQLPMFPFTTDAELIPLVSFEQGLKSLKQMTS